MYDKFAWTRYSLGRNKITRHYEPLQPHLLMTLADYHQSEIFLDVGANIGAYAVLMTAVESIETVHAFEPSPETLAELRENIRLNDLDIEVHPLAASSERTSLNFGIVNTFSGANSVIETSVHEAFERSIVVQAAPLDAVLDYRGRRLCIKIDVEGHEREALLGMAQMLATNEVILQIEDFSEVEGELTELLAVHGLKSLFRINADRYFGPVALNDRQLIEIFEEAAQGLIKTNLAILQESWDGPLVIPLGGSAKLQLSGRLASFARGIRKRLKR